MVPEHKKMTKTITNKLHMFINWCLCRIEQLICYDEMSNVDLMERVKTTKQIPANLEVRK